MEHQYTQTGSLVRAILGASLSEAKTDNVGKPQYKSGAPHPPKKNYFFHSPCCHLFFFLSFSCSRLKDLENKLTITEQNKHQKNVWQLSSLTDYSSSN